MTSTPRPRITPAAAARADQDARSSVWEQVMGQAPHAGIRDYLRQPEWTCERVTRLGVLVDHACTHRTAPFQRIIRLYQSPEPDLRAQARVTIAQRLMSLTSILTTHESMLIDDAFRWLEVVVASTEIDAEDELSNMVLTRPAGSAARPPMTRLLLAARSRLAPLAWAAGFSPEDARAHREAGTLDEESLLLLAGLRGFHLPVNTCGAA